jgi:hypothetical protein
MTKILLIILLSTFLVACSSQATTPTQEAGTVIVWQRSGGFAGICQRLTINQDGSFELVDCIDEGLIADGTLSPAHWDQVSQILERYGEIQYAIIPPEGTADMFSDEVSIRGTGSATPTQEEQAAISEQLAQLASELTLPQE